MSSSKTKTPTTYANSGVDIDAGNALVRDIGPLAKRTSRAGADVALGGFGGLFDLKACGFKDPVLVACNDGVGTKVKVAIEAGLHSTIGIDLVAMCVNDLVVQGAEPLFFLDYYATGKLDRETARQVIAGISDGCVAAGCALIGGETAEMPGLYAQDDYDLAGFSVGAVERDAILPRADIAVGDVILGLSSNGVHSNGYSLVRRLVSQSGHDWSDAPPFESDHATLAEDLLRPTRIYVKSILSALRDGHAIKALAHITGGGLTENIPRVLPEGKAARIKLSAWQRPSVFQWLQEESGTDDSEMLKTFNCGIGMVVVCAEDAVDKLQAHFEHCGETVSRLGQITDDASQEVVYDA